MKKKIALGLLATMVTATGVAMASPQPLEQGQWQVKAGAAISPSVEVGSADVDGNTSFYGGITYGINDDWGIQYDYSHYDMDARFGNAKGDAHEFNVLYKLNDNINAFAGYNYFGYGADGYKGDHTDGFLVGLQGHYDLTDRLATFAKVGIGNNSQVYEVGFGYEVADNWDLDLSYHWAKYEDLSATSDMTFKGVRAGISTSF